MVELALSEDQTMMRDMAYELAGAEIQTNTIARFLTQHGDRDVSSTQ